MAKEKIICQHLILCEGVDAKLFFIHYLNSDTLAGNQKFSTDIQVMDFGGNQNLPNYLELIRNTEGFDQVKSILIIRDSESDPASAIREIQSALFRKNFCVPGSPHKWECADGVQIGFSLFPTCDNSPICGTLEDLCCAILSEPNTDVLLSEVNSFLATLEVTHNRIFPRKFKNKLHTYFSSSDSYVSLKIGEAAKAGAFDWSSPKLDPLKNFILEILT